MTKKKIIFRRWQQEKVLIGMPVYGRTFTLADPNSFDIGSEVIGGGEAGRYTGEEGFLSHYEICDFLQEPNTTLVWDNEQQVSYAQHCIFSVTYKWAQ